jgi:ribosomal protein S18 acetylase RimI-like enzyme
VDPNNTPAINAYRRLGYAEVCRLVEAPVTRRDLFGFGPAMHRMAARWNGRGRGVEIVK